MKKILKKLIFYIVKSLSKHIILHIRGVLQIDIIDVDKNKKLGTYKIPINNKIKLIKE